MHPLNARRRLTRAAAGAVALVLGIGCDQWLTKVSFYNTVDVTVTRRNGEPIPGSNLVLYTGDRPVGYATSSADGHFTFERVPQGLYGVLATIPPGYEVVENLMAAPSSIVTQNLRIQGDTTFHVRFTFLKKGPGSLAVNVTSAADGAPLAGVPVTVYSPAKVVAKVPTDAGGRVRLDSLPFGLYGVSVERPLFYRDFLRQGDSLVSVRDNIVIEEGSREAASFALTKCAGFIRARMIDDGGKPVPGVTTVFYTATAPLLIGVSDVFGLVGLGDLPCGTDYGVFITPAAGYFVEEGRGTRFIDGIVPKSNTPVDVIFHLHRSP
jgi:hypothetical protein